MQLTFLQIVLAIGSFLKWLIISTCCLAMWLITKIFYFVLWLINSYRGTNFDSKKASDSRQNSVNQNVSKDQASNTDSMVTKPCGFDMSHIGTPTGYTSFPYGQSFGPCTSTPFPEKQKCLNSVQFPYEPNDPYFTASQNNFANKSDTNDFGNFESSNPSAYKTPPSRNNPLFGERQSLTPGQKFPLSNISNLSSGNVRKNRKPDSFDGKSDWADYLKHFEAVATWNGWTGEEKAVQLIMSLSGTARQTWSDCWPDSEHCYNYDVLVNILAGRFKPEGQEEAYKAEFRGRCKKKTETFMDFGFALRRLGIRAFPKLNHEAREDIVRDQFLTGLVEPEMRKHVSLAHPKNLDQAITMASEYDLVNQSIKPKPPVKPQNIAAVQERSDSSDSLVNLIKKVDQLLAKRNRCKKCGDTKHETDSCTVGWTCFYCKEVGHISSKCPKKKKSSSSSKESDSKKLN